MYKIDVESISFPSHLTLPSSFEFSKAKIAWAAMTTGKPNKAAMRRHAGFSLNEVRFRWNLVLSAINFQRSDSYLESSVLFNDMDPSEKGGINYFLGMAFAKMAAQELLDVPWLAHFTWYKKQGLVNWQPSRSTADLVGEQVTTGDYVVLEAKGRNNHQYGSALSKAVSQAKQNYIINSVPCSLRVGSVLFREEKSDQLSIVWEDPEPTSKDGTLELKQDREFWREYYSTPWDLWSLQQEEPDRMATQLGFRIDLEESAVRLIKNLDAPEAEFEDSLKELRQWSRGRRDRRPSQPLDNWNGDGIIVEVTE